MLDTVHHSAISPLKPSPEETMDPEERRPLLHASQSDLLHSVAEDGRQVYGAPPPPYSPTRPGGIQQGLRTLIEGSTSTQAEESLRLPLPPGFPVMLARVSSALVLVIYMGARIGSIPLLAQYMYARLMPDYVNMSDSVFVDTGACTANYSDPRVITFITEMGQLQVPCTYTMSEFR